jgi:hypothetical protein
MQFLGSILMFWHLEEVIMLSPVLFYPQYRRFGFLYINKHVSCLTLFTRYWIVITAVVFWIFPDCNNKLYDAIFAVMYSSGFCNQHRLSHFTTVTSHFDVNLGNAWLYVNGPIWLTHSITPQATVTSSVVRLPQLGSGLPHFTLPRVHFCIHKSLPTGLTLGQINPLHVFQVVSFLQVSPTKNTY